ncbi:hypothetical protein GCM10027277_55530 [Pseudoduganella ginsengisoli]|uniref:Uncharacterized protein n=1 Tax=Pseudoduganella ginsengisoli TaxID=1462440 RepID=A0A6L6Q6W7_9BURK|nr:hypothetical protein [Pseudoduganella ginsengisoli]MTW04988.1 hypothetical protein [Pseudoduganella ginsengisoli]
MIIKALLNWIAAAASLIGLFFTLRPVSGSMSLKQMTFVAVVSIIFTIAAIRDILEERRRLAKRYRNSDAINSYMFSMLKNSGRCEICSRDASWVTDAKIYALLKQKASRRELTFLVHRSTPELIELKNLGAEIIVYGSLGFDPITRFTVVNSGNQASSYVAIGRRKPNEHHVIEELDSSHPTYSMALDLIRSIKIANDNFKKI